MPFCANCGAPVEGSFCAKCGAPVVAGNPPPGANAARPAGEPQPAFAPAAPLQDNVAAALCYVLGFITGIVFLVREPYSRNRMIRFHAFQSIFANVAIVALEIVLVIVFGIFIRITNFFGFLVVLWPFFWLACIALWLWLIISAYEGKTVVLPVVGPFAQKQAQS
jgi:uncharacterized membrane protein